MIEAEQLHARILEKLDLTREVEDEELTGIIYQVLQEAGQKEYIPLKKRNCLMRSENWIFYRIFWRMMRLLK